MQTNRVGLGDEEAQDAMPSREPTDLRDLIVVETDSDEVGQLVTGLVEDTQSGVTRPGDLRGSRDDPLKGGVEVQVAGHADHCIKQRPDISGR
jgi:hypothetical protein